MSIQEPSPTKAILRVLEDGPSDGLERVALVERAAAHSQTTRDDVEHAIEDLRKHGEIYGYDHRLKKTFGGSKEERWGGFS